MIWFAIGAIIGGIQFATSTDKNPSKLNRRDSSFAFGNEEHGIGGVEVVDNGLTRLISPP